MVPRLARIEVDTAAGEQLAVAVDEVALDSGAHVGAHRVAQHIRHVAHARRAAHDRPVQETGTAATANVDEEVADVRIAVDQRRGALTHSRTMSWNRDRHTSAIRWNDSSI